MRLTRYLLCVLLCCLLAGNTSFAAKSLEINTGAGFVGKPHAPVEMEYVLPNKIVVAKKLTIHVSLINTRDIDAMDVSVRFDDQLQCVSAQKLNYGVTAKQHRNQVDIECVPQSNGLFYVHLMAVLYVGGQQQSRSFVIPVNVGGVASHKQLKATGVIEEDALGERIISMPAEESPGPAK